MGRESLRQSKCEGWDIPLVSQDSSYGSLLGTEHVNGGGWVLQVVIRVKNHRWIGWGY